MNHRESYSFPSVEFNRKIWEQKHNLSDELLLREFEPKFSEAQVQAKLKEGIPIPFLVEHFYFRNHLFYINSNAYITDPEASFLVDLVHCFSKSIATNSTGKKPLIAEFGIGGGALSTSLVIESQNHDVVGFDIDAQALQVAYENKKRHKASLEIFESDFFKSWPLEGQPDILFADPPWGSREDLYDDQRDADYYDQMPPLSAYPPNGRIGLHLDLLKSIKNLKWSSVVILNLGIIPREIYAPILDYYEEYRMYHPTEEISLIAGYLTAEHH